MRAATLKTHVNFTPLRHSVSLGTGVPFRRAMPFSVFGEPTLQKILGSDSEGWMRQSRRK